MASLPLLIFPKARPVSLPTGKGFTPSKPHFPSLDRQRERMQPQLEAIQQQFKNAQISLSDLGLEPEMVLIIEIVDKVEDFKKAIEKTEGLEWLAEWDMEDIPSDDDFYADRQKDKQKVRSDKALSGSLFLSMSNEKGMQQLLNLWEQWKKSEQLPHGQTSWRDVFGQIKTLGRWGIEDQFSHSGMLDYWNENLSEENIFRIELFYSNDPNKRKKNEENIKEQITQLNGKILSGFIDIPEIRFHAAQVQMPREGVEKLVDQIRSKKTEIALLQLPSIMYCRPRDKLLALCQKLSMRSLIFLRVLKKISQVTQS